MGSRKSGRKTIKSEIENLSWLNSNISHDILNFMGPFFALKNLTEEEIQEIQNYARTNKQEGKDSFNYIQPYFEKITKLNK